VPSIDPKPLPLLLDDIVERYDNLSKSVSDRNEKLQITLTRSLSVQDGLDEMMSWMEGVEESVKEKGQVLLDSAVIGDVLSKEAVCTVNVNFAELFSASQIDRTSLSP
jgi:dystonin